MFFPNVPQIRNGMYLPLNQINKKVFEKYIDVVRKLEGLMRAINS